MTNKMKLQRLRDLTIYHLSNHEGTGKGQTTMGQLDALEYDIKVWIKNFLLTCEQLSVEPHISWIGETGEYEKEDSE